MEKNKIIHRLNKLVHERFKKEELKEELIDIFGLDFGNIDEHFLDGKDGSDMEIYDDRYCFDLEIEKGIDIYADVYFIKTNEDLLYVTEVYVDFNEWGN